MVKRIVAPLEKKKVKKLKAGDEVLLSGIVYTARDAAHKRMVKSDTFTESVLSKSEGFSVNSVIAKPKAVAISRGHSERSDSVILSGAKNLAFSYETLPFDLKGQIIYYTGPTPAPPGKIIGSCGPTTSYRMDSYTPTLLRLGLKGMIGKGDRSQEVIAAIKKYQAIYFIAFGGCGALYSHFVKKVDLIAYPDLGCEAILKLEVEDFPLIVGIDCYGRNIYKIL